MLDSAKRLLAQFLELDMDREGTVYIRSQWDVASLARLIRILGFRGKEDAEYLDSLVNGGHIGATFTGKALEMIDIAARDGPLLIFCQLGHLAVTAVPLNLSGLKPKDMEKVLKLQMKVIENKRLPLKRASDIVWYELGQLREQVDELCCVRNTGNDRTIMERLLPDDRQSLLQLRSSGPVDSFPWQTCGETTHFRL